MEDVSPDRLFPSLLHAQRSLYASEDALVQSTRSTATDLIALYKALGGGWVALLVILGREHLHGYIVQEAAVF